MTIDYTIPGATQLNQLSEPTMDGLPDENANDNCVPSSIAEGLHILTGGTYDGDELKDAVYGQGWTGFQSAARYVAYCAAKGVTLAPHNDTQAGLVATIHAQVDQGHPVVVTMPSQWGTAPANPVAPSGTTHVGLAVGTGPGYIRVMNPWGGFWQDQPDDWWQARLCEGQVWPMMKAGSSMSGVPSGWTDDGTTLKSPGGIPVVRGMRAFVLANAWDPSDVPVVAEQGVPSVEIGNASLGAGVIQWFLKSGQLTWVADFNGGNVFRTYNGQEEHALRAALSGASSQVSSAQAQVSSLQGQVAQLQAQITQLQTQLAALQNAPAPAPVAAPLTAAQQADLAVMAAIRAALG